MLNRKIYSYLRDFFETEKKLFLFLALVRLVRLSQSEKLERNALRM